MDQQGAKGAALADLLTYGMWYTSPGEGDLDERSGGERLGVAGEMVASAGIEFLPVEAECVGEVEDVSGLVGSAGAGERLDEPERAR
jgi:hypothetical protein